MEIALKINIGKLSLKLTIPEIVKAVTDDGFSLLPISGHHLHTYTSLPLFEEHKDPFDRFIIATAIAENCEILTSDNKFKLYNNLVDIRD
jgi:PIN domain nuclease of toxin-antitoxin system